MNEIAEQFEERFADYLNERHAGRPSWSCTGFHRYSDLPPEFQSLVAMSFFEQQNSGDSVTQAYWTYWPK